jgi:hypothetical protein
MGVSYLGCTTRCGRIRRWATGHRHRKPSCRSNRGHGDVENAARFPHPHTPGGDDGQMSNEALH